MEGLPGSVSQVRAVATALVEQAKRAARPCPGRHVDQDGQIAGPKLWSIWWTRASQEGDRQHLLDACCG